MIDLSNILSRYEDYTLEAKSAKGGFPDSFWETYSAFANSDGGTILFGVEETQQHQLYMQDGLKNAQKMKDDLMLELYGNPEELAFIDDKSSTTGDNSATKDNLPTEVGEKLAIKAIIDGRLAINSNIGDKSSITDGVLDKLVEIVYYLHSKECARNEELSEVVSKSTSRTKEYLQILQRLDIIIAEGANKNRTYKLKK